MAWIHSLQDVASDLFERELAGESDEEASQRAATINATPPHYLIAWVLPELLELLSEQHDQPAERLRSMIRRLILERGFPDAGGDWLPDDSNYDQVEAYVDMIVRVLEHVRRRALRRGQWSDAPVTPLMCG